jgi:DMSO reductase anchor subunit
MHPAPSIIVFTSASGAGYGLLFLLSLGALAGLVPSDRWFGLTGLVLALGLISVGLAASTLHLKHPERAWRALSQWRSSWLSREGVMAGATYVPAGTLAIGWIGFEATGGLWSVLAVLAALGAVGTVFCTGSIYASLRPIRQWHQPLVVPIYMGFAVMTGALWLTALLTLFAWPGIGASMLALVAILAAWGLKIVYWRQVAADGSGSTVASATGLDAPGGVRMLDPPHTEENYLLHEMGYRVGRKHAERLRQLAVGFGAVVPFVLLLAVMAGSGGWAAFAAVAAALSGSLGVLVERWLFFAEATHTVTLYYGAQKA